MPKVSVIIPAYNAAETIGRTIQSVLRQTFRDFEIVVIDDGSTDDTAARVAALGDPRIHLRSYENARLPAARNRGIAAARGEYLAFLDADDLWAETKIQTHVEVLEQRPDVGVVYSWTCTIDDHDRVLGRQRCVRWEGDVYSQILEGFFIGNASNSILRREVVDSVGAFDESLDCGEDWEFLTRAASRWRFAVVPQDLVFYRWREGSMSSDGGRMCKGLRVVVDRNFERAPRELQGLRARSLANVHAYVARTYLTRQTGRAASRAAARSLRTLFRVRPALIFDPATLRLCARWLVAWVSSPQQASALAGWYHRMRGTPPIKAKPSP